MKKYFILILVGILYSCSNTSENKLNDVKIRIANISQHNFENITINTSNGIVSYENLIPNQISNYQTFEIVYKHDLVYFEINGIFCQLPFDDDETIFENGSYTCTINANESLNMFTIGIVED